MDLKMCLMVLAVTFASTARAGMDDCYEDVEKAKQDCTSATLKAGELNRGVLDAISATISGAGAKQTGSDLSSGAITGIQNSNWANSECAHYHKTMNQKCTDAAQRMVQKQERDRENLNKDQAAGNTAAIQKDQEALQTDQNTLDSIRKNAKNGHDFIQTATDSNNAGIAQMQGYAGTGDAVSNATAGN